ncbi:MAG: hypothetical protein R3F30_02060 [Planctomycetota bacterium]
MPTYELARSGIVIVQQMTDPYAGAPGNVVSYEEHSAPIEMRNGNCVSLEIRALGVNFATGYERLYVYLKRSNDLYSWETGDPTDPTTGPTYLFEVPQPGTYTISINGISSKYIKLQYLIATSDPNTLPAPAVGTSVVFDAILSVTRSA